MKHYIVSSMVLPTVTPHVRKLRVFPIYTAGFGLKSQVWRIFRSLTNYIIMLLLVLLVFSLSRIAASSTCESLEAFQRCSLYQAQIPLLQPFCERPAENWVEESEKKASDRRRRAIKEVLNRLESAAGAPGVGLERPTSKKEKKKKAQNLAGESLKLIHLVEEGRLTSYYAKAYHLAAVFHFDLPLFSDGWQRPCYWAEKSKQFRNTVDLDFQDVKSNMPMPLGNWMHKLLGKKLGNRHSKTACLPFLIL